MPTERSFEFTLLYLMSLIVADHIGEMANRMAECAAIEQATYDREFWELVSTDG